MQRKGGQRWGAKDMAAFAGPGRRNGGGMWLVLAPLAAVLFGGYAVKQVLKSRPAPERGLEEGEEEPVALLTIAGEGAVE